MDEDLIKNYIVRTERGYLLVVEGASAKGANEAEITDNEVVTEIARLLKVRNDAGVELSKLISDKGLITASAHSHSATIVLGEGE